MIDLILTGLYAAAVVGAVFVLCLAAWTDFMSMRISNTLTLALGALFIPAYLAAAGLGWGVFQSWQAHGLGLALMLAVTFIMFLLNVWGGGDSKLATAIALWIGVKGFFVFLLVMAVMGFVLSLVVYAQKWIPKEWAMADESWFGQLRQGQRILPYGIALVVGALAAFHYLGYFDLLSLIQSVG
jgi:prepilin peptidase CpaA